MAAHRVAWIDAAKGIGIALIVVGHVWSMTDPSLAYQIIYGFHVPLFFLLAGLTFDPQRLPAAQTIARKARTLLVPYLCFGLLGYVSYLTGYWAAQSAGISLGEFDHGLMRPLLGIAYGSLGDGRLANSPIWFLTGLFSAFVMLTLIHRGLARPATRALVIGGVFLLGLWIGPQWTLPWSLAPAMLALPFMALGMVLRQPPVAMPGLGTPGRVALIGLAAAITALAPVNGYMQLGHGLVGHPGLYLLFAAAGSALVLLFAQLPLRVNELMAVLGRHSLEILVLHMLVIKTVQVVLAGVTPWSLGTLTDEWIPGLTVLALTAISLPPLILGLKRWLPLTLGRW